MQIIFAQLERGANKNVTWYKAYKPWVGYDDVQDIIFVKIHQKYHGFCQKLHREGKYCYSMFQNAEVDLEQLFGNIEEVADVSQRLLTKLEEALYGKDFDHQVLGELSLHYFRIKIVRSWMYPRDFSPS